VTHGDKLKHILQIFATAPQQKTCYSKLVTASQFHSKTFKIAPLFPPAKDMPKSRSQGKKEIKHDKTL
jgi:hypothetical protein